jgi:phosphohistidine phosphatase
MSSLHVYLVRHEEAEPGYDIPDALRALTGKGRQRMRTTGKLVLQHAEIDLIYTSPLVRAVQTAELLATELGFDEPLLARDVIANPPTLGSVIDLIAATPAGVRGVALVGHEPTMSELSAELLDISHYPRPFKKGSVLALDFDRTKKRATFRWLILGKGPELVHDLHE